MAVGLPLKTTYANGDVYSASDVNDTNGTVNLFTSSTLSVAAGKNTIINGGLDIWQRGTSVSQAASSQVYTADRWNSLVQASTASTISRQATSDTTNLPNIQYCVRVQRNSGQTGTGVMYFANSLETVNSIPFTGKAVTVSFYARKGANYSPTSSALAVYLWNGTGTDQQVNSSYTGANIVGSVTATLTTTWQRFTFTGTVPTNSTELAIQAQMTPTGTASTNDYYEITGVQLELGSTATTFSRAGGTIQGELAACQRYYLRYAGNGDATIGVAIPYTTTNATTTINFPITMRVVPTSIDFSSMILSRPGVGNIAVTAFSMNTSTSSAASFRSDVASGLTSGAAYFIATSTSSGYIGFSAEL
jgi:hypothetical protein